MCKDIKDVNVASDKQKIVQIEESILSKNLDIAKQNRKLFTDLNFLVVNIVSSPGSGKTTTLERTIKDLKSELNIAVIEGDQQTDRDSQRIKAAGAQVYQINTMNACHLDAKMIQEALSHLQLEGVDILFIENVGNLICPGSFDLGEDCRAVVLSITEGEDKSLKYPGIFTGSDIALVNKIDVATALEADPSKYIHYIKMVSPSIKCLDISAKTGQNIDKWYQWLRKKLEIKRANNL